MEKIFVTPINQVFSYIDASDHVLFELSDMFTFDVPGAKFSSAFKNHHWDGKMHLFNVGSKLLYTGLIPRLAEFANQRSYEIVYNKNPNVSTYETPNDIDVKERITKSILHLGRFFPHKPRDYQIKGAYIAIKEGRRILISPTASGKSLMMYLITSCFKEERFLITVPTKNLVKQLQKDFLKYGCDINDIHIIMAGCEKDTNARIVISTWQSIYEQPRTWFEQFTGVIGDECHLCKGASLRKIMNSLINAKVRIAVTGTLEGAKVHQWLIEGMFGPIDRIETTANLIKQGHISDLRIDCVVLRYSQEDVDRAGDTYQEEIDFLVQHRGRREFVRDLALALKGNTLILFDRVENHGVPLFEMLEKAIKERNLPQRCYLVYGGTDVDQRERLREIMENETGVIGVASMACIGTGTNINNLHNAIMASPTKAPNRLLQAIGRILRLAEGKSKARWFDISDDLTKDGRPNCTLRHFFERIRIYKREEFKYRIHSHQLTKD